MVESKDPFDYQDKRCISLLLNEIKTDEGLCKFVRGLYTMAMLTNHVSYKNVCVEACKVVRNKGINVSSVTDGYRDKDTTSLTVSEASKLSKDLQSKGRRVGFLHGFYRIITIPHLFTIVRAGEECDDLLLGMERSWRAKSWKGKETATMTNTDKLRENVMVNYPNLVHKVVALNRIGMQNNSYIRLVRTISPNIYFGTSHDAQEVVNEKKHRASQVGAEYYEIETVELSTTELLQNHSLAINVRLNPFELPPVS